MTTTLTPIDKLGKEVRLLGAGLDREQARALVDVYYRWQEHRIALANQARAARTDEEPTLLLDHFAAQVATLEKQMVGVLDEWTEAHEVGRWSKAQKGIGPVLAAGLLAHIDIEKAHTAGAIWRFAGLDPTVTWGKGEKRPWNADLKVLCWKIGDSFVKVSGKNDAFYGQLYRQRKTIEVEKNQAGAFAETAVATLAAKKFKDKKTRELYEAGTLPDGRIDLRARRWAVKIFLAHWFEVAYEDHYGKPAPLPYPIAQLGHVHKIERP